MATITNPDRMEAVLEDSTYLSVDGKISNAKAYALVLEKIVQLGKPSSSSQRTLKAKPLQHSGGQQFLADSPGSSGQGPGFA